MQKSELEKILIDSLRRLGVKIRMERLEDGSGGFCRLDDEPIVVYDPELSLSRRIDLFMGALNRLDTSGIYLPPVVRDRLDGKEKPSV